MMSLVARILEFGFWRWESWRLVGADIVLFRMNRVSRPNSAENKSYDVKREVGATVLHRVPMKYAPLTGDANFSDLWNLEGETRVGADVKLFPTSRVSRPNST